MPNNTVSIQMTAHQLAIARLYVMFILPLKTKSAAFILAATLLLIILANYVFEDAARFGSVEELITGALLLTGTWMLLMYKREREDGAVAQFYAGGFQLTLEPGGLRYGHREDGEHLSWDKFTHFIVAPRWLFFYFGRNSALIVPRSAFQSEEQVQQWITAAQSSVSKVP